MTFDFTAAWDYYDVVHNGSGRFAKRVGNDSIKGYIANGEHILIAVFLAGFAGNQLETVPRELQWNNRKYDE